MIRKIKKICIKCGGFYQYITKFHFAKNSEKYELNNIGFSLARCYYCQQDLDKEENYSMLMKRLGDSNKGRRQNFKRIVPLNRKKLWMTYGILPSDLCLHCGVRTESGAYRDGRDFIYCSKECKNECERLPYIDICLEKGAEDFTCFSENHSEYMYRTYDQLFRQSEKKIQQHGVANEKLRQLDTDTRKLYFERMQIYKDLWDKDRKYGSIDRLIRGL